MNIVDFIKNKRLIIAGILVLGLNLFMFISLRLQKTDKENNQVFEEFSESLTNDTEGRASLTLTPISTSVYYSNSNAISTPTSIPTSELILSPILKPTTIPTSNPILGMYPEKINLSPSRLRLDKNQTKQLDVKFEPEQIINKKVTWTVNDGNILRVTADGLVTALDTGIVTVSVMSENGLTNEMVVQVLSNQEIDENFQVLIPDAGDDDFPDDFMIINYDD